MGCSPCRRSGEIEIGWWLARAWWGQGLATEAGAGSTARWLRRVGLPRIVAIAQPANTASIGIMQKLGMRFDRIAESRGIPVVLYALWRTLLTACRRDF